MAAGAVDLRSNREAAARTELQEKKLLSGSVSAACRGIWCEEWRLYRAGRDAVAAGAGGLYKVVEDWLQRG